MKKLLLAAALGILMTGSVLSQNNPPSPDASSGDPGGADKLKSITDPKYMAGFYSDTAMTKMRSPEEVKEAWGRLSIEDQVAVKNQCKGPDQTANMKDLCMAIEPM